MAFALNVARYALKRESTNGRFRLQLPDNELRPGYFNLILIACNTIVSGLQY